MKLTLLIELGIELSINLQKVIKAREWIPHLGLSPKVIPFKLLGTLSNRRRRPDDGNRKRDISFETSLRMYNTLWPDVAHSRPQSLRFFGHVVGETEGSGSSNYRMSVNHGHPVTHAYYLPAYLLMLRN